MNIKHIVLGIIAAAAVLVGCEPKEEDFGVAKIEVSPSQLAFTPSSGSQSIQVTASRDWTVSDLPEWIAVDPAGGAPSKSPQAVTVTVIANNGYDREADITFTIGLMKEYVKVSQNGEKGVYDTGDGSKERPYSASAAVDYVGSLPADTESTDAIYIKGVISAVTTTYEASGNYGNATFDISDDGSTTAPQFKVFQTYYLGNKKWTSGNDDVKVGDEVIIYGKVVNYRGNTPETVGKGASYVYSHNGKTAGDTPTPPAGDPKGTGVKDDPYNVAAALDAVKNLTWTNKDVYDKVGPYYVKGKIASITEEYGTQFGNATFTISDDGTASNEFTVYRALYLGNKKFASGNTQIKVGDEVVIYGELMNYHNDTPETVQNGSYLYSLNGETGSGTATETDHGATTVANFLAASESTSDWYELTGTISNLKEGDKFGNFDLTDASGTVYVYGVLSTKGGEKQKFQDLVNQYGIANGGTITIKANRGSYQGKDEAVNAYFISYSGGDTPPATETDHGATTVANFLAASESTADWYELTGTISNLKEGDKFGNFDLTDDSGTVYVYGVLSTKGGEKQKFQELVSQYGIANGGTITIKANRGSYQDKIEAVNAYFVSYNGQGGPGGDDTTPTDIASIIGADDETAVAAENVYVGAITTKGYVATDGKKSIYVYGNAAPTVAVGDIVKFSGTKTTYYGLPEITSPKTTKTSTGTVPYPDPVDITASFDSYTATEAVYVKYKAKMFKSGNYTNFKVDGAELTGSFSSAPSAYYNGINEGDEVVVYGYFNGINTNNKLLNVIVVKIENLTTGETIPSNGSNPGGGGETTGDYTSNLKWTLGDNAYDNEATVNGTSGVSVLKLGTSSKVGTATVTIPAGTKKITFYGVSWKGKEASVAFKVGGETVYKQSLKPNDGAANNSPFTMTVTSDDQYTYTLSEVPSSAVTATITTDGTNTRIIVFGLKAE